MPTAQRCSGTNICLPRLNRACQNPSKWRESLGIRVTRLDRPCPERTRPARRGMDAEAHQATADRTALASDVQPAAPPLRRSPAPETLRLYAGDWAAFVTWCRLAGAAPLPAAPATVADYLATLGERLSAGALARRAAAIAAQHRSAWAGLARIRPGGDDAAAAGPPHRHTSARTSARGSPPHPHGDRLSRRPRRPARSGSAAAGRHRSRP